MELLEYLIQLHGGAATSAELKGVAGSFREVGKAAQEAGVAANEGAAAASGKGSKGKSAAAGGFGAAIGKMAKVGAVGLVALGLASVKMSNQFQTQMLRIRTEAGATQHEFTTMRAAVLNLAATGQSFGQGPTSLAQGLYHLESMGIRGSKAILGLKLASAEAAISGANLEDTTTSLGGALFIAAKGTGGLKNVMGALNAIAGAGNMRFQELNDALGTGLLGAAKTAGVSLQEMGAALAVLTDSGYKASSAGAQLGTALHYLYSPTQKAEGALESIGLTGAKLAQDLRKPQGILAALRDLRDHMAGLSPTQQAGILNSLLPGGRGRVLLNLYQLQNRLAPKYGQITGTQNDFGKHMMEQSTNPATKLHVAIAKLDAAMIMFGDDIRKYVMPVAIVLIGVLAKIVLGVMGGVEWFTRMGPEARALAVFIGLLVVAFGGYRLAMIAATIAQAAFNAVMTANPIGLLVVGISALIAALVLAYEKVGWFRKAVQAAWSWIKTAARDTANWVVNAWHNVVTFFEKLPGRISKFFRGLGDGIKGAFVSVLNWIIDRLNSVIGILNSLHISTPFGDIGVPHINPIGHVGAGNSTPSSGKPLPRNLNHSTPGHQGVAPGHNGPLIVHGDIVVRARENELGRVTRRQVQKAMAS